MEAPGARPLYVVVALFAPLEDRVPFPREDWPAHVTLAPGFRVDAAADELVAAVGEARATTVPLEVRIGGTAWFGSRHDVPVRLADGHGLVAAHDRLTDRLERVPGFTPASPRHWREGFRPHVTLGRTVAIDEGDRFDVHSLAVVRLGGGHPTSLGSFPLPERRDAS